MSDTVRITHHTNNGTEQYTHGHVYFDDDSRMGYAAGILFGHCHWTGPRGFDDWDEKRKLAEAYLTERNVFGFGDTVPNREDFLKMIEAGVDSGLPGFDENDNEILDEWDRLREPESKAVSEARMARYKYEEALKAAEVADEAVQNAEDALDLAEKNAASVAAEVREAIRKAERPLQAVRSEETA